VCEGSDAAASEQQREHEASCCVRQRLPFAVVFWITQQFSRVLQPIRPIDNDMLPLEQTLFLALAAEQASAAASLLTSMWDVSKHFSAMWPHSVRRGHPHLMLLSNARIACVGLDATVTPHDSHRGKRRRRRLSGCTVHIGYLDTLQWSEGSWMRRQWPLSE
jgi:hypothetical protein